MYKCQITGRFSKRGDPRVGELQVIDDINKSEEMLNGSEKLNKIVVETRSVEYKHWDREAEEEWFSYGTEIVKEISATDEGVRIWESWSPEKREAFLKTL